MLKINSPMFRIIAIMTAVVFLSVPLLAQAQTTAGADDYLKGKTDGERDAKASAIWFFAGFCFGLLGVLVAFLVKPSPSTGAMIGKSQIYINGYIDGYKSKSAKKQGSLAVSGCLLAVAVNLLIFTLAGTSD
jgi:hypothetical protein